MLEVVYRKALTNKEPGRLHSRLLPTGLETTAGYAQGAPPNSSVKQRPRKRHLKIIQLPPSPSPKSVKSRIDISKKRAPLIQTGVQYVKECTK
jgi:hypothetical protein